MLPPALSPPDERLFLYPGVMVVSRDALRALPVEPRDTPETLWEPARVAGRLGGAEVAGTWREVGTPIDYLNAVRDQLGGLTAVHPTATVASGAETVASYIGESTHVGDGSIVTDSVIAVESGSAGMPESSARCSSVRSRSRTARPSSTKSEPHPSGSDKRHVTGDRSAAHRCGFRGAGSGLLASCGRCEAPLPAACRKLALPVRSVR